MLKKIYLLIVAIMAYSTLQGMEDSYINQEELKKRASVCTAFGMEVLEKLNSMVEGLRHKNNSEEYNTELGNLNAYIRDAEQAVILHASLDELEELRCYKIRGKGILQFQKKKYVSATVWEESIKELKKNQDGNCTIQKNGALLFVSVYHAALHLDTLTSKRRQVHAKLGFESFYKGSRAALAKTE